jgi:thiol-disulfide isomerase/thioredoxin
MSDARRRGTIGQLTLAALAGVAVAGLSASAARCLRARPAAAPPAAAKSFAPLQALVRDAGFTSADRPRPAPSLDLVTIDGRAQSLAELHGRPVVCVFWGTACAHCLAELPALERLADEHPGLTVLAICADDDDPARVEAVARRHSSRLPIHVDPEGRARRHYDVAVLPSVFLIDAAGRLLGRGEGGRDWTTDAMEALLRSMAE